MKESSSILTFLKKIIRKIHTFFRKPLSKDLLIFLIFLFVSCFFWVLQSLQGISEVDVEIPINYGGIPANISITNKLPKSIRVTLRDKGTNLYYYYRHRKEFTLHLNPMDFYLKDGIAKIPLSSFDGSLRNRLMSTTQLLSLKPNVISIYFVEKSVKTVPVHLNSRMTLSFQHSLSDNPLLSPSSINLYAPATVLANLKQVETEMLDLEDLRDSTSVVLKLKPIDGVRFSSKAVRIQLNVEEFTEKSIIVPITGLNFPAGEDLLSFPPSVKVTFFVGLSSYSKITEKNFQVTIDRTNLLHSKKIAQKVMLTKFPVNVRNIRIHPESVECLIEKK